MYNKNWGSMLLALRRRAPATRPPSGSARPARPPRCRASRRPPRPRAPRQTCARRAAVGRPSSTLRLLDFHKKHGGAGRRAAPLPPHQRAAPAMPRARGRDPVGRAHHARAPPGLAGAQPAHPGASTSSRRRLVSSATRSSGSRKCSSYASPGAAAPPRRGRRARPPSGPVAAADARHISAWPTASTHACARAPLGRPPPGARRAHRGSQAGALSLLVLGRPTSGGCRICTRGYVPTLAQRDGVGCSRPRSALASGHAFPHCATLVLRRVGVAVAALARARLAVGAV